jgi:hypothetical protein
LASTSLGSERGRWLEVFDTAEALDAARAL